MLRVDTSNDGTWIVELGNPRQTARSGFSDAPARAGEEGVALGNRSLQPGERRLKAGRITMRDRRDDLYPDRVRGS
jgi:hypothetical protein